MDIRKIKKLIEMVEESGMAELEIREGEESVRISRYGPPNGAGVALHPPAAAVLAPVPLPVAPLNWEATPVLAPRGRPITSPMVA